MSSTMDPLPQAAIQNLNLDDQPSKPRLSNRSHKITEIALMIEQMGDLFSNQYSNQNVNGLINFGIAENTLVQAELKEYLNSRLDLTDLDFTYGDSLTGSSRLFNGLSRLFDRYFKPVEKVLPEHIITGAGLGAVIDQTVQLLCDEGEAILVARPYYSGFASDVSARSNGVLIGVDTGSLDPSSPETLQAFESELQSLKQRNINPRVVILCNPHNPLGFNYPRSTLLEYCKFCEKHNLHLLSDEIYALSQFQNIEKEERGEKVEFTSMLSVDVKKETGCDPARVHVLYGMSKDFCANGLRIGALITQHNQEFRRAFIGIAILMKVSSASDALWSALLNDDQMLDTFVTTNQRRLSDTFAYCREFFRKHDIPIVQPEAAHFIFIDLRKYLRDQDDSGKSQTAQEQEADLFGALLQAGLFVAPGAAYMYPVPGWFRFTFCIRRDYLDAGLKRFEKVLDSRKS